MTSAYCGTFSGTVLVTGIFTTFMPTSTAVDGVYSGTSFTGTMQGISETYEGTAYAIALEYATTTVGMLPGPDQSFIATTISTITPECGIRGTYVISYVALETGTGSSNPLAESSFFKRISHLQHGAGFVHRGPLERNLEPPSLSASSSPEASSTAQLTLSSIEPSSTAGEFSFSVVQPDLRVKRFCIINLVSRVSSRQHRVKRHRFISDLIQRGVFTGDT